MRDIGRSEGPVTAGVARHQIAERVIDRFGKHVRNADRQRASECIAQPAGVLDRGPSFFGGDSDADCPAALLQFGEPAGCRPSRNCLGGGERPDQPKEIRNTFDVADLAIGCEVLQFLLDLIDRVCVQHLAQLRLAEQFTEQHAVEGECLRAAFGERGVAFVDERRDVSEQQ